MKAVCCLDALALTSSLSLGIGGDILGLSESVNQIIHPGHLVWVWFIYMV